MTDLATLQRQFYRAVAYGEDGDIIKQVRQGPLQPHEQLQIYRNNAQEGFRKTLATAYPTVERLVGLGCFRGLTLGYVQTYPSDKGDLSTYGRHFPTFLKQRYEVSVLDYLADVAELEWAYQEVMMAADADALRVEDLAGIAPARWENLCFQIHPAVRLVASRYPVFSIWKAHRDGRRGDVEVDSNSGENVLLQRKDHHVELRPLDAAAFTMMKAYATEKSLTEALRETVAIDPSFDLQAALANAFTQNLFSGYSLLPTAP